MDPDPGWYPDVQRPGQKRWWDGARWTEHRRSADASDDPPPPDPRDAVPPSDATVDGWRASQMPGGAPMPRVTTSGLAIASVVFGLLWIFGIGSAIGIVLGAMALRRIRRARGLIGGRIIAWFGIAVSSATLVGTILVVANFDEVVEARKADLVELATDAELRRAADAMERLHEQEGAYASSIGSLAQVGYRPPDDVTLAVGRATTLAYCLEALHVDGDTVRHLVKDAEPASGRCR